jgi:hypothetical protein
VARATLKGIFKTQNLLADLDIHLHETCLLYLLTIPLTFVSLCVEAKDGTLVDRQLTATCRACDRCPARQTDRIRTSCQNYGQASCLRDTLNHMLTKSPVPTSCGCCGLVEGADLEFPNPGPDVINNSDKTSPLRARVRPQQSLPATAPWN